MTKNEKKKRIRTPRNSITLKSLIVIVILLVIFSVIASWIGYHSFTQVMMSQYTEGAFQIAEFASSAIDPDEMDTYINKGPSSESYDSVMERLEQICNATGATFVYVIRPDQTDYWHVTFIFSAMNENSSYARFEFGYRRETTNEEYRDKYQLLCEGASDRELVVRDKGYISTDPHITAMIPLKGSDGNTKAILCVQRQMDVLSQARRDYVQRIMLVLILLAAVAIIGEWIYLHKILIAPVKTITGETARFASENTVADQKLQTVIRNHDEIGQLAQSIDHMEEQIADYVDNLTQITAEKERILTELSLAAKIQMDMLPSVFPPFPDRKEFDLYAVMDPAWEVGGDFYDFFLIDEDHLCLVMADVSGKGIPAALFMMAARIILKDNAMGRKTPAEILRIANTALGSNNKEEMFVTVWLGILEISTGKITAVNAGHEYPILAEDGKPFELIKDTHGFVVGIMENIPYQEYELQLRPGSRLFLYTDGLAEATNVKEELFGTDRILDALNKGSAETPKEVLEQVKDKVDEFVGEARQFDDLTMMCFSYYGKD